MMPKLNKKFLKISAIIFLVIIGFSIFKFYGKKDQKNYMTVPIVKGDLVRQIGASGIINPINIVKVSTQVSGIIEKIYVDFNDKVKKGQLLAELDKSILQSQLDIVKSNLNKSKISKELSALDFTRTKSLFEKKYIARSELDKAQADFKTSQANYDSSLSEYKKAQRNLSYAIITSPVSGVVISREVEEGQTVSASTQAPDLFKIAEDLTKMQIETAVAEADISAIKKDQEVRFTVDAYQYEDFKGIVRQIRLNPTTDQNVVTYVVVIDIDNQDLKLLPGMTAFVTIDVDKKENILKIPNAVFNFKMPGEMAKKNEIISKDKAAIYILNKSGNIKQVLITKGLSNEIETEISAPEIKEGDLVIEDILDLKKSSKNKNNMGMNRGPR